MPRSRSEYQFERFRSRARENSRSALGQSRRRSATVPAITYGWSLKRFRRAASASWAYAVVGSARQTRTASAVSLAPSHAWTRAPSDAIDATARAATYRRRRLEDEAIGRND